MWHAPRRHRVHAHAAAHVRPSSSSPPPLPPPPLLLFPLPPLPLRPSSYMRMPQPMSSSGRLLSSPPPLRVASSSHLLCTGTCSVDAFADQRSGCRLNFGIHLDDGDAKMGDAALCLLPGTHRQSFLSFCFRKLYFLSTAPDPQETCVTTKAGDVTVHDGARRPLHFRGFCVL